MQRFKNASLHCLLAAALFGAATPWSKALLGAMGPLHLAGLLYLGAALATLPWALRDRGQLACVNRRNGLLLGSAVLFGGGLGPVLMLWGLSQAPAASVALWLSLEPVATSLLAWALFREHMHARTWTACALVCAAGVILAAPSGIALGLAALLVGLACLCWGLDNCVTALIDRLTPAQTTFAKGAVAGSLNLALGLWLEGGWPAGSAAPGALAVGVLSYGLSLVLYITAAQQLGALRSQLIFASAPLWGVLGSWVFLSEPITGGQGLASAIVVLALWLLHAERHEHAHSHVAQTHTHLHRHDDGHHDHTHPGLPRWVTHSHEHAHAAQTHAHAHRPDLHHRHEH